MYECIDCGLYLCQQFLTGHIDRVYIIGGNIGINDRSHWGIMAKKRVDIQGLSPLEDQISVCVWCKLGGLIQWN